MIELLKLIVVCRSPCELHLPAELVYDLYFDFICKIFKLFWWFNFYWITQTPSSLPIFALPTLLISINSANSLIFIHLTHIYQQHYVSNLFPHNSTLPANSPLNFSQIYSTNLSNDDSYIHSCMIQLFIIWIALTNNLLDIF